ncbi:SDR family NAD(P)-dependent oxidoreductase [Qipengyuania nanhaisediminis]|uniref:Probable oxidoreductase n=1 Tax=Qipengyuania nanhaisediminis TaxID=604088 RepID=A0A1I5L9L7_9SPHN|nr:SDR family NAD(P)-dependent oxidoreductase [Qipengyuania nanhaisediminis]SFO93947.1 NAD(P)-dependent dehydrogenase, short-chain alcohol dehydrogenase family [Qipengyuania nanhaisediminis]
MSEFGFESTADDVLEGKDLSGRTALVTGGYSGLGQETARAMAAKGAHIILSGRDATKLSAAADAIAEQTGATVDTLKCDLASLDSIRKAAAEANERFEKIDLLINNAGVMACDQAKTADGFEMQFGTNHVGHFLLTNLLVPLLEKGERPRIVNLSSRGHHIAPVDFDDPNFESRDYDKWVSYGQSKTANVLFAVGLEKRLSDKGIHAYSLHPGGIMTNLGRHMSDQDMADLMERIRKNAEERGETPEPFKTIPQGAATTCWAATAEELEGNGGLYCENCHVADQDDESTGGGVRSYAIDPDKADRLWSMSEKMVGESFTY